MLIVFASQHAAFLCLHVIHYPSVARSSALPGKQSASMSRLQCSGLARHKAGMLYTCNSILQWQMFQQEICLAQISNMIAHLEDVKCISLPKSKRTWKVCESNGDIIACEGKQFVRVAPSSHTLTALVLEPLETKMRSITASVGLRTLTKLRNEAFAAMMQESLEPSPGASLFDLPSEAPKKKPKKRLSDRKKVDHKDNPMTLDVVIHVDGEHRTLKILQPFFGESDNIFVEYEPASLGLLLQYLRQEGFDDEQKLRATRDGSLPKGIRARKDGKFIVAYTRDCGGKGYKTLNDLESAVAFQANPNTDDADPDDGGENDADTQDEPGSDEQVELAEAIEAVPADEPSEQSQTGSC